MLSVSDIESKDREKSIVDFHPSFSIYLEEKQKTIIQKHSRLSSSNALCLPLISCQMPNMLLYMFKLSRTCSLASLHQLSKYLPTPRVWKRWCSLHSQSKHCPFFFISLPFPSYGHPLSPVTWHYVHPIVKTKK